MSFDDSLSRITQTNDSIPFAITVAEGCAACSSLSAYFTPT